MTANEFLELLASYKLGESVTLPVPIKIGEHDCLAAQLILWLIEQLPEDATQGDIEDVLDMAKWWAIYWGSAYTLSKGETP